MFIKGVNLGNWLVLEKWMNPNLFSGTTAEDEYWLPRSLSPEVYEARIKTHREQYITERDFITIKSWGLNAVRIPIPYFIFGDRAPFIGCVNELDKAFKWAERYDIKILIELHTVPGSQNGFDNGGISGVCKWSQQVDEVEYALTVLERLAIRYGHRDGLWGIELLNEPLLEEEWIKMDIPNRYPAVDEEMAKGSCGNSINFIKNFYLTAYDRIKHHLHESKYIVFHDCFKMKIWKDFMRKEKYRNVVLDTHLYLMLAESEGCEQTLEGYLDIIENQYTKDISEMMQHFPVICGEWSIFNSLACGVDTRGGMNIFNTPREKASKKVNDQDKTDIYRILGAAQLKAWRHGVGYFYWNYKSLIDTVNTNDWNGWDSWDLGRCIGLNWIDQDHL